MNDKCMKPPEPFFSEAECEAFRRSEQLEFGVAEVVVDEGCQKPNSKSKEKPTETETFVA